jgi:hypothetical protein
MKRFALVFLLCSLAGVAGADDALVQASAEAKSKRKGSTTKVITNKDLKKSKGVLIEMKGEPQAAKASSGPTASEKRAAEEKAEAIRTSQVSAVRLEIDALLKDLARIEQNYYDENDLQRRDTVLVQQFSEVKLKLDAARARLLELGEKPAGEADGPAQAADATAIPPAQ